MKLSLTCEGQSATKTMGILTKVLCIFLFKFGGSSLN